MPHEADQRDVRGGDRAAAHLLVREACAFANERVALELEEGRQQFALARLGGQQVAVVCHGRVSRAALRR